MDEPTKKIEIPDRSEIDDKYKWDLSQIFADDEEWEKNFRALSEKIGELAKFKGKLGSSAENLYQALYYVDKFKDEYYKLRQYANLAKDLDLSQKKYLDMAERASELGVEISAALSYFEPEILKIPEDKIREYISSSENLKTYERALDNLLRMKTRVRSEEIEELLSRHSAIDRSFGETYKLFSNVDIEFPSVKNDKGEAIKLSPARYIDALRSNDRSFRERAYKAFHKPFKQFKNAFASLYLGSVKSNIFYAKARNYETALEWALDKDNIPAEVYFNLIKTVNDNLEPLWRWAEIKKKALKLDALRVFDTYNSLFPAVDKKYSYEEAREIVLEALSPLGEEYIEKLKFFFDNRRIDVFETKNKRSGAYSSGAPKSSSPYVLLNWSGNIEDVFTLAHELGHSAHSQYAIETQPYPYAGYPIFLAEVASTVNEALLFDYLYERASSNEEKGFLLEKFVNEVKSVFYRQTRFAEFELKIHSLVESGEPLTAEAISSIFGELYQKYWGPAMRMDEEEKYSWARIPHFYYDFYVFCYATSFAAAQKIAENVKNEGASAARRHIEFLKAGDSLYPLEALLNNGVDLSQPTPIKNVAALADEKLNRLESLLFK